MHQQNFPFIRHFLFFSTVFWLLISITFAANHTQAQNSNNQIQMATVNELTECELGSHPCIFTITAVDKELKRRIRRMSTEELTKCLLASDNCQFDFNFIKNELVARKPVALLIQTYRDSQDSTARESISETLYNISDPRITIFMRQVLTDDDDDWYPKNYLAKRGDEQAMEILAKKRSYPMPSYQWAESLEIFGKYSFRPAIPCLMGWADAASLNAADAAIGSLRKLCPGSPKDFSSPEAAQAYFKKRYADDGCRPGMRVSSNQSHE
jgi:hypothetical protein